GASCSGCPGERIDDDAGATLRAGATSEDRVCPATSASLAEIVDQSLRSQTQLPIAGSSDGNASGQVADPADFPSTTWGTRPDASYAAWPGDHQSVAEESMSDHERALR